MILEKIYSDRLRVNVVQSFLSLDAAIADDAAECFCWLKTVHEILIFVFFSSLNKFYVLQIGQRYRKIFKFEENRERIASQDPLNSGGLQ